MAFRVSFKFNVQSTLAGGWSENFWNESATIVDVEGVVRGFMPALQALHGAQVVCNKVAIAYVPKQRKVKGITFPTAAPGTPTDETDCDYPTTALLISLTDAGGTYTQQWIKGIPDNNVKLAGRFQPQGNYNQLYGAVRDHLTSAQNNWRMRVLDPANTPKPVRSIDAFLGVITAPAHGMPVGTNVTVRISGVSNLPAANGVQEVYVTSADTLTYNVWTPVAGFTVQGAKKSVALQVKVFRAIAFTKIERITKRNVGRPTASLTGRRRKQKTS